jgi:hypothetical protein
MRNQRSQLIQINGRFVINSALSQRGIRVLKMIRERARPDEWLAKNRQVQFLSGTEILQFTLEGKHPKELARVVNAVSSYGNKYYSAYVEGRRSAPATKTTSKTRAGA